MVKEDNEMNEEKKAEFQGKEPEKMDRIEYEKPDLNTVSTKREIFGYVGNCSMGQATSPRKNDTEEN
jgi:hypothetical protein